MTFAEEGDDMLMGFKGGGLRLKESKILPALAGWRGGLAPNGKSHEKILGPLPKPADSFLCQKCTFGLKDTVFSKFYWDLDSEPLSFP